MPVVVVADTVVEPRTVVVHLQDATVTDAAMVGSGWFWLDAFLANSCYLSNLITKDTKTKAKTHLS